MPIRGPVCMLVDTRDRARRGPVFALNLIDPGLSDRVNPLDLIRIGTIHEAIDADQLATLLVVPDDDGKGGHWDEMARQLISVVLRIVVTTQPTELRTLAKAAAPKRLRNSLSEASLPSAFERSSMYAARNRPTRILPCEMLK